MGINRNAVRAMVGATAVMSLAVCSESKPSTEPKAPAFTVEAESDSVRLGLSQKFAVSIADSSAETKVIWSSSDTTVAVVDATGSALGVSVGTATIGATVGTRTVNHALRVVLARADGGVQFVSGQSNAFGNCAISTAAALYCRYVPNADAGVSLIKQPGAAGIKFVSASASFEGVCGLSDEGRVYCWGRNGHWAFGTRVSIPTDTGPVLIKTPVRFSSISYGGHAQVCGVGQTDSLAYCWGHNDAYQLARGYTSASDSVILPVSGNIKMHEISTSNFETCFLAITGKPYCAGGIGLWQSQRGLGIADNGGPATTPMPVTTDLSFTSIFATGDNHRCGLTSNGDAYCWGNNDAGQLGAGDLAESVGAATPRKVAFAKQFSTLRTLYPQSTCGISTDGDIYCWGAFAPLSVSSRLGANRGKPYRLTSGIAFKDLSQQMSEQMCAVTVDGRVFCWKW